MTQSKNIRAFVRPLRDLSLEDQLALVQKAGASSVYTEGEIADARAAWLRALRPTEVALLPRLDVLAVLRTPKGPRPSVDFTATLAAVSDRCLYIQDATHGITSRDGKRWHELVAWAAYKITVGRALPTKKARAMARKRWKDAKPGTVRRWLSPIMDATRHRWAQHWRDPKHGSEQKAFDALPDEIKQELGSKSTARRIFNREE
jgi:hypothetical protein